MSADSHRKLSLVLFVSALAALWLGGPASDTIALATGLFVCLAFVWYPGELGSLVDMPGGQIDRESPASFVRFFGWIFLIAGAVGCFIL